MKKLTHQASHPISETFGVECCLSVCFTRWTYKLAFPTTKLRVIPYKLIPLDVVLRHFLVAPENQLLRYGVAPTVTLTRDKPDPSPSLTRSDSGISSSLPLALSQAALARRGTW
jgi:hypothetical protein